MQQIDTFLANLPPDKGTFPPIATAVQEKYASLVPGFLLDIWENSGICSFGNGFIWTVNPDDYTDILPKLGEQYKNAVAVLRTGLGTVFFKQGDEYLFFDPVYLDVSSLQNVPLEIIMNYTIGDKRPANELFYQKLYEKALKRLGPPAFDECFAFVPAIALGGEMNEENLQKMKLREQLILLTQLI